jgi:hypothetical protein
MSAQELRICQNCKQNFVIEPEDFLFYEKIKVPPPTWCPECRMMRRFIFRNQRNLFRRKDDASGKDIFASFPQSSPVKVYEHDYWWSDKWDSMSYGRDYDFSRPFFEQFRELFYSVPLFSRSIEQMINSDYCDQSGWLKNCYLCFDTGEGENSAYNITTFQFKECFDLYQSTHDELCYECVMVDDGYKNFFSVDCDDSRDLWFCKDMGGCSNCFGCVGLRNKSYYIFNEPYSREEYFEKLKELNLGSFTSLEKLKAKTYELWSKFPVKFMHGQQNINVSGEHIQNAKNVHKSYLVHGGQDSKYIQIAGGWSGEGKMTDCYDHTNFGYNVSLFYEATACGMDSYNLRFCWECWRAVKDLEYCAYCASGNSDLFGCVGLRNKQYCILNKQYSKEEYFALREKIINHMEEMPYKDKQGRIYKYGEFFPPEFSPFAYNETMAYDFFPITEEEAKAKGFSWREPETREFHTTTKAAELPDHINEVDDSILKQVIACASCSKAYRIIQMEFDFLKKMGLPLPRLCPNCRFFERMKQVNPPKFWHRACQCAGVGDDRKTYQNIGPHFHGSERCPNEFETSYAPERPEMVYCEVCYNSEIL